MMIVDRWVRRDYLRLHVLETAPEAADPRMTPLVIVPGTAESAEDYADLIELLAPRRCVAISLRGRGQSSAPQGGYTLADHVGDVAAVIEALKLPRPALYGFSRGVAYTLAYAASFPRRPAGLILGDYPAEHRPLELAWIEHFARSRSRGVPVAQKVSPHVIEGLQREADAISLWEALPGIPCPVLILRGGQPGTRLSLEDAQAYVEALPDARVVRLEDSGHALWKPDLGRFVLALAAFLDRLDGQRR